MTLNGAGTVISIMAMKDKGVYVAGDLAKFRFPKTKNK